MAKLTEAVVDYDDREITPTDNNKCAWLATFMAKIAAVYSGSNQNNVRDWLKDNESYWLLELGFFR